MKRQKRQSIKHGILVGLLAGGLALQTGALAANTMDAQALEARTRQFISHANWPQAISLLQARLSKNAMDWQARCQLFYLHLVQNNHYEAETLVTQAAGLYPQGIEPLFLEAENMLGLLVEQGNSRQEEASLSHLGRLAQQAAWINESSPYTLYLSAMHARLAARPEEAETQLLRALYVQPNFVRAQQALVDLYLDQHQVKLAVPFLNQALELSESDVDNAFLLGRVFFEKGDPARALVHFKKSEHLDGTDRPKRLWLMAESQRQLGQLADAARNYQRVLSYWPNRADIWQRYGDIAHSLQKEDDALQAYRKAYQLQPAMLDTFMAQAERTFWTKPLPEAIPAYKYLLDIAPERKDILLLLVDIYYRLWQEGASPSASTLDELESALRRHERETLIPPLQLADLQVQVMRASRWLPGLRQVTAEVAEDAVSPFVQAKAALLLAEGTQAQSLLAGLPASPNPRQELQRFALLGAWEWGLKQVEANPELQAAAGWMNAWADTQQSRFQAIMAEVQQFLVTKQPDPALQLLDKAQVYHPFSPEIPLAQATIALQEGNLEQAQAALALVQKDGLDAATQTQWQALQKQVAQALKKRPHVKN